MGLLARFKAALRRSRTTLAPVAAPTRVSRAPRVRVLPLLGVRFEREAPSPASVCVSNLSSSGLGLLGDAATEWPAPGASVRGQLVLGEGPRLAVRAKVVRTSSEIVGLNFMEAPPGLAEALRDYFKVESAALRLRPLKPEMLEANPEGTPACFAGENNTQLYYTERAGLVTSFELSFFGNHIEAYAGRALRFGSLSHDEVRDKAKFKGSTLVFPAAAVSEELRQAAARFVENVEPIDARIRGLITAAILSGKL